MQESRSSVENGSVGGDGEWVTINTPVKTLPVDQHIGMQHNQRFDRGEVMLRPEEDDEVPNQAQGDKSGNAAQCFSAITLTEGGVYHCETNFLRCSGS